MTPIAYRTGRILTCVMITLIFIGVRSWHLAVVQHERRVEEARRPQRREKIEKPLRGTIRDRFGIPLAVNKLQYNASILYGDIRQIPRRKDRINHVKKLSKLLSDELEMDAGRIEDLIYSKAALFPNVPYVIKENISEQSYYKLRHLERSYLGLMAEKASRRHYPQGRVGGDLIGYLGPISREEYEAFAAEKQALEGSGSERLEELSERAYTIHDLVGKSGIEGAFDEQLHGFCGKRAYLQDIYGSYIRELPGSIPPLSGQRVVLSISSELQAFAEQLLIENEEIRRGRAKGRQPWIMGGAIAAIDPNNGEVLALASYPRIDPTSFAQKENDQIERWFETRGYMGAIWDGFRPLERETARGEEALAMTWGNYLDRILDPNGQLRNAMSRLATINDAIALQESFSHLLAATGAEPRALINALYPDAEAIPRADRPPPTDLAKPPHLEDLDLNYNRLLMIDLARLAVDCRRFPRALREAIGSQPLETYRNASQAALVIRQAVKEMAAILFRANEFATWRKTHEKRFLREKRRQEKGYQRPYLDYLDREERRQFNAFWEEHGWSLITLFLKGQAPANTPYVDHFGTYAVELARGAHKRAPWHGAYKRLKQATQSLSIEMTLAYLKSVRSYKELTRPLYGDYRHLRGRTEEDLAFAFYPKYGFGYGRSFAYRQALPQGSVFKIVTGYAALAQRYIEGKPLNPLTIVDDWHKSAKGYNVGYTLDGKPIPQSYKGGMLLRTQRRHVGEIDLPGALEVTSNCYFGLLAADVLHEGEDLNRAARALGYGAKTGIELPGEFSGKLPTDLNYNRTGLYAYSDGQHSLVVTPLQTALMLSTIANGGRVFQPRIVRLLAGKEPERTPEAALTQHHYPLKEPLRLAGIDLPLFTRLLTETPSIEATKATVQRTVLMPRAIQQKILEGLNLVTCGPRGGARPALIRSLASRPWVVKEYRELCGQLIGKTSTAEMVEAVDLDPYTGINTYNHIWFAGIGYPESQVGIYDKPELVVVVMLRYGDYGREAAPLAAQILKKWRELN